MLRRVAGSLLGPLARELTGSQPRILFYHRFSPDGSRGMAPADFERQLDYIARHFNPVPLGLLARALAAGEPLPRRAVAITIDDGYQDFHDHAYPVLLRRGVPATLYAVSRFAAGELWLWFDRLRYVCMQATVPSFSIETARGVESFPLGDARSRAAAWDTLSTRCLTLATDRREALIAAAAAATGVTIPSRAPDDYAPMDLAALRSLDSALIDVGAHTQSHPILANCEDEEVRREVGGSVADLTAALGRPVTSFCYPNGQPADFDSRAMAAAAAAGCTHATASSGMLLDPHAPRYALPRFGAAHELPTFRHEVDGLTYLQSRLTGRIVEVQPGEIAGRRMQPMSL